MEDDPRATAEYYLKLQHGELAAALAVAHATIFRLQQQIAQLSPPKLTLVDKETG